MMGLVDADHIGRWWWEWKSKMLWASAEMVLAYCIPSRWQYDHDELTTSSCVGQQICRRLEQDWPERRIDSLYSRAGFYATKVCRISIYYWKSKHDNKYVCTSGRQRDRRWCNGKARYQVWGARVKTWKSAAVPRIMTLWSPFFATEAHRSEVLSFFSMTMTMN